MKNFWFPSACKSYVYTLPQYNKCAITLCLKNVHAIIITWSLKNSIFWAFSELSFCWWSLWNIARINKTYHRDSKWANAVGKMTSTDPWHRVAANLQLVIKKCTISWARKSKARYSEVCHMRERYEREKVDLNMCSLLYVSYTSNILKSIVNHQWMNG